MLRIHEIKLGIDENKESIGELIIKKIGLNDLKISEWKILKESIDARDKGDIKFVYSVDFSVNLENQSSSETEELILKKCTKLKIEKAVLKEYNPPLKGEEKLLKRPVIAGFGPCGIFAGLILAQMGYKPIILERGKSLEDRVKDVESFWETGSLNPESNVQFGEGGAGLFSDGKLTTQIKDERIRKVLKELVKSGGSSELLYKQKPHIGTDELRKVVYDIRNRIIELGGEIRFNSKLTSINFHNCTNNTENVNKALNRKIKSVIVNDIDEIDTDILILAIGHSARDTFRMLNDSSIIMEQKPFSIGVRIEHPQEMINQSQYGKKWAEYKLGAADYKLSHRCKNGRGVYTFCMCPGGYVIGAASEEGAVVTNGMSYNDRGSSNANSALLVDVRTEDFESDSPLAGIEFQEKYEKLAFEKGGRNYKAPAQRVCDFMNKRNSIKGKLNPTYKPGVAWANLSECLPEFAVEAMKEALPFMGRKLKGFDMDYAVMTGVETRSSSPVRITRDERYMSNIDGIYPSGEGAGYAGGIMSAAVDGIKIAEEIVKKYSDKYIK